MVTVDVVGDAFLRQMVRSIVAALLRIGHGTATATDLDGPRCGPGQRLRREQAPPHGLCLRVPIERRGPRDRQGKARG